VVLEQVTTISVRPASRAAATAFGAGDRLREWFLSQTVLARLRHCHRQPACVGTGVASAIASSVISKSVSHAICHPRARHHRRRDLRPHAQRHGDDLLSQLPAQGASAVLVPNSDTP
jgi:hypothetical protein